MKFFFPLIISIVVLLQISASPVKDDYRNGPYLVVAIENEQSTEQYQIALDMDFGVKTRMGIQLDSLQALRIDTGEDADGHIYTISVRDEFNEIRIYQGMRPKPDRSVIVARGINWSVSIQPAALVTK